jgi:hypothetical protein
MRASTTLISGLAAVTTAAASTSSWGSDPKGAVTISSYSSSTTSYSDWSAWSSSSSTYDAVSTSTSYDPWTEWTSSSSTYDAVSTSTSYDPWTEWTSSSTVKAAATSSYDPWTEWSSAAAATTACPPWTGGTAPPAYYTNLPESVKSALPSWTGAPPSDYCLYTSWMQSFSSCTSPAAYPTTLATTSSYPAGAAKGTSAAYGTWTGSSPYVSSVPL